MSNFPLILASVALLLVRVPVGLGQPLTGQKAPACRDEIGLAAADRLRVQCRDASPATHPPCGVSNGCATIRAEIARSCRLFEKTNPLPEELCAASRTP